MNVNRKWFEEASSVCNIQKDVNGDFIIYKGFKITKGELESYKIEDVRHSEFYSAISLSDYGTFIIKGFIAGADFLSNDRNIKRVVSYKSEIKTLETKRRLAKKEIKLDVRLNKKRIRLAEDRILELRDLIVITETRIKQFNSKYN